MINLKVRLSSSPIKRDLADGLAVTEWWEADDFYAWEQRKRKRAKAKGDIDSDDEREMTEKLKKTKKEESPVATGDATAEVEHLSD